MAPGKSQSKSLHWAIVLYTVGTLPSSVGINTSITSDVQRSENGYLQPDKMHEFKH